MAVKNAAALLDEFCRLGITVEVSHRAKRRLFGLAGMAPLRDQTAPPRRPEPGRGRGRPPLRAEQKEAIPQPTALPPVTPVAVLDRRSFDYSNLDQIMAQLDDRIRQTRHVLRELGRPLDPLRPDALRHGTHRSESD